MAARREEAGAEIKGHGRGDEFVKKNEEGGRREEGKKWRQKRASSTRQGHQRHKTKWNPTARASAASFSLSLSFLFRWVYVWVCLCLSLSPWPPRVVLPGSLSLSLFLSRSVPLPLSTLFLYTQSVSVPALLLPLALLPRRAIFLYSSVRARRRLPRPVAKTRYIALSLPPAVALCNFPSFCFVPDFFAVLSCLFLLICGSWTFVLYITE